MLAISGKLELSCLEYQSTFANLVIFDNYAQTCTQNAQQLTKLTCKIKRSIIFNQSFEISKFIVFKIKLSFSQESLTLNFGPLFNLVIF